jgi:hypothetical protein
LKVLRMWRSYGHWHHAHIEAAVKGRDQIEAGRIYECHMIPSIKPAFFNQQASYALGLFVKL